MAKPSPRPPVAGPPLIRTLGRIGQHPYSTDPLDLPATLGSWVDWNRAVALARALDGTAPEGEDVRTALPMAQLEAEQGRARDTHREAIHALLERLSGPQAPDAAELQRLHATLQRGQLASTGRLRGQLRDCLALQDERGAQLAEIDAVMEQVIAPREYRLLDALSAQLGSHAARQLAPQPPTDAAADAPADTATPSTTGWPPALRDTARDLLLAELDLRFQPIEGLLAALRQH